MNKTVCLSSDYIKFFGEGDTELSIKLWYIKGSMKIVIKEDKKGVINGT